MNDQLVVFLIVLLLNNLILGYFILELCQKIKALKNVRK